MLECFLKAIYYGCADYVTLYAQEMHFTEKLQSGAIGL